MSTRSTVQLTGRYTWALVWSCNNEGNDQVQTYIWKTKTRHERDVRGFNEGIEEKLKTSDKHFGLKFNVNVVNLKVEGDTKFALATKHCTTNTFRNETKDISSRDDDVERRWNVGPGAKVAFYRLIYTSPGLAVESDVIAQVPLGQMPEIPPPVDIEVTVEVSTSEESKGILPDGRYRFQSVEFSELMFGGAGTDRSGDHYVWVGSKNCDEDKDIWKLEHVKNGNVFRILSEKWGGPLFSGDGTDRHGDHYAWVHNSPDYEKNTTKCLWRIEKVEGGKNTKKAPYVLYSLKHGGKLFAGDGKDRHGEHYCWTSKDGDFEVRSKHMWFLQPVE